MHFTLKLIRNNNKLNIHLVKNLSYIQGQEPEPKIREYFYYIDHQGMVIP